MPIRIIAKTKLGLIYERINNIDVGVDLWSQNAGVLIQVVPLMSCVTGKDTSGISVDVTRAKLENLHIALNKSPD